MLVAYPTNNIEYSYDYINNCVLDYNSPNGLPSPIISTPKGQATLLLTIKHIDHRMNKRKGPLIITQPMQTHSRGINHFQIGMINIPTGITRKEFGVVVAQGVHSPAEIEFEFSLLVYHHAEGGCWIAIIIVINVVEFIVVARAQLLLLLFGSGCDSISSKFAEITAIVAAAAAAAIENCSCEDFSSDAIILRGRR